MKRKMTSVAFLVASLFSLFVACGEDKDTYEEQRADLEAAARERERLAAEVQAFDAVLWSAGRLINVDNTIQWWFTADGTVHRWIWQPDVGDDGFWIDFWGTYSIRHDEDPLTFLITCSFDYKEWERGNAWNEEINERVTVQSRRADRPWTVYLDGVLYKEFE